MRTAATIFAVRPASTPRRRRVRPAWLVYLATGVTATISYFGLPSAAGRDILYDLVGISAVVAIVVGVRRNRPGKRTPWMLLAAGQMLFVVGDVLLNLAADVGHDPPSFPSTPDVLYLLGYPLLGAALVLLVRYRAPGRDRASVIDAGIITSAIGLVSWVFVMAPYAHQQNLSLAARMVSVAYPLADIMLLGIAVRLSVGSGTRTRSYRALLGALATMLVADTLYAVPALNGSYQSGSWIDAGWLLSYVLFGAVALHPSMATLTDRVPASNTRVSNARLTTLAVTAVMAPLVLAVQSVRANSLDISVVAVGCVALFLLVLWRMAGLVREVEGKVDELRAQGILLRSEQEALAELRELNRMKTEFVAVASHELRTPLTSLIGYTKTLQLPQFKEDEGARREFLQAMERQGHRLLDLVENLLTASTIEHSTFDVSPRPVPVEPLVHDVQEGFADRAARILVFVDDVPPVLGDAELLTRAMANLVDNALKYSPGGSPCEIEARAEGDRVLLSVQDHGVGIERADRERIFDRFYQVDSSSTRRVGGVGLGLSLTKEIVEALGGSITVESTVGEGARFTLSLPAAPRFEESAEIESAMAEFAALASDVVD